MLIISLIILILCKALYFLKNNLSHYFFIRISSIILLFSSFLVLNCINYNGNLESGVGIYGGLFQVTELTQIIELLLLLVSSIILISWPIVLTTDKFKLNSYLNSEFSKSIIKISDINNSILKYSINYSILLIFSSIGASLFLSSSDLISMYICIELQSFSLYILSTLFKDFSLSTSAGLKYFLLGGLASCLILLGSSFVYSTIGLTNFESISILISNQSLISLKGFQLGLVIIFIGFLIKIAAAPLHNWSPDVYNSTPTIVTIWLTIIPKLSILIFLFELVSQLNLDFAGQDIISNNLLLNLDIHSLDNILNVISNNQIIKYLLLIVSLISLIVGGIVGLNQKHIKRLLAYSTISHLGFILLALSIFSEQSIESFIFYIIQYTLTNLNIFLILLGLGYLTLGADTSNKEIGELNSDIYKKDISLISDLKGKFYSNPIISICFSICFFSLAGIPPLIGFFSKQFVLLSSIQEGYYFITLVGIIVSVISASYYLKVIKELYYESETDLLKTNITNIEMITKMNNTNIIYTLSNIHSYIISILTLIILFFIIKPSLFLNTALIVSLNIFPI